MIENILNMIGIVIPYFDDVINILYSWIHDLIYSSGQLHRIQILDDSWEVNYERVGDLISRADAIILIAHGTEDHAGLAVTGEIITDVEHAKLFSNKFIYALSCSIASIYGVEISKAGGGFLGYNEPVIFIVDPSVNPHFRSAFFTPVLEIIRGKTLGEAYHAALNEFTRQSLILSKKYEATMDPIYKLASDLMIYNREIMVLLGNPELRLVPEKMPLVWISVPMMGLTMTAIR